MIPGGFEVPTRLCGVERAPLEKDVCSLGKLGGLRQDLADHELDVRLCLVKLGRHGVEPQVRRDAAFGGNRSQGRELGVAVQSVARFRLERRRPPPQHPAPVPTDCLAQLLLTGPSRGANRREDAAAGRVQLLVARPAGAQRELLGPISREARVRVAVDEPRHRSQAPTIELLHVAVERAEFTHAPDVLDAAFGAEDVRVFQHVHLAKRGAAEGRGRASRRRDLAQVADEEPA